jgi:hypothetical protein
VRAFRFFSAASRPPSRRIGGASVERARIEAELA